MFILNQGNVMQGFGWKGLRKVQDMYNEDGVFMTFTAKSNKDDIL